MGEPYPCYYCIYSIVYVGLRWRLCLTWLFLAATADTWLEHPAMQDVKFAWTVWKDSLQAKMWRIHTHSFYLQIQDKAQGLIIGKAELNRQHNNDISSSSKAYNLYPKIVSDNSLQILIN